LERHSADLVPISRFRIPGFIIGEGIDSKGDARVVSQIDLAPTLLSLIGISDTYPMLGRDLTVQSEQWQGRAMMQYEKNFALMEGNKVTILQPERSAESYEYDFSKQKLTSTGVNEAQAKTALGWALWGSAAYNHQWFSLAPKESNILMPSTPATP
jgi:phosphoglycerol transferase MdoB-like AlkP superfamily enzyme